MNDVATLAARSTGNETQQPAQTVLTVTRVRRGGRYEQVFIPVKNEPGEMMRIDKGRLRIDHEYQRRLDTMRVAGYAANWSWVSCGTLLVAQRSDDATYFWVIDGQHRLEAARMVDSIRELPCIVFKLDVHKDEAIGFLAANTHRKLPSLADQFRALIIAEQPEAQLAGRLAAQLGRRISHPAGPTTISCAAELLRLIQGDRRSVEEAWDALGELCHGQQITARMMRGVIGLQRRMTRKENFSSSRWSGRLVHVGYDAVRDEIVRLGQINRAWGERVCAEGVLRAMNKGLRQPLVVNLDRRFLSAAG